mmetsp:Transcript_108886/g.232653  ORF Transcript_108886/g.232653 Transcript_108886/m.232653 type:complete len:210 (-) Transcript_108886:435-1064(-)
MTLPNSLRSSSSSFRGTKSSTFPSQSVKEAFLGGAKATVRVGWCCSQRRCMAAAAVALRKDTWATGFPKQVSISMFTMSRCTGAINRQMFSPVRSSGGNFPRTKYRLYMPRLGIFMKSSSCFSKASSGDQAETGFLGGFRTMEAVAVGATVSSFASSFSFAAGFRKSPSNSALLVPSTGTPRPFLLLGFGAATSALPSMNSLPLFLLRL